LFYCWFIWSYILSVIWTPKFSLDIEDINSKIETAQKQKQKLDNDLANIETLKRNLEMKTVQNERLETYLA